MSIIRVSIDISAPPTVCFDLARSVDAHVESTRGTSERAVAGVTTGLLALGDEVTWRARHLGITQELTSRITAFDRPRHFRDEMVKGAFRRLVHDHHFDDVPAGTRMVDAFDFTAPLGFLGTLADRLLLREYLSRFLRRRAQALKQLAESDAGTRLVGR
ncbi:MAG TPA: SRPBCC family protein [Vicinamibacterales bacterium]|nr:SRPBCC family protein [Vicinamibacterales bacterium]